MRLKRSSVLCLASVALACAAQSSGRGLDGIFEPLAHDPVTVWVVKKSPLPPPLDLGYHEHNAGDFGRTASSTGRAASDTATSASSFGHAASDTGQTASSYGQTAGSFGRAASDTGQTASTYGVAPSQMGPGPRSQTASSYGRTASSVGVSIVSANSTVNRRTAPQLDPWEDGLRRVHSFQVGSTPNQVSFVDVDPAELKKRLENTVGTPEFPDVLVGNPLPLEWPFGGLEGQYGVTMLGSLGIWEPVENRFMDRDAKVQLAILLRAPHPDAARAFVTWMRDQRTPIPSEGQSFTAWRRDHADFLQRSPARHESLLTQAVEVAKSTATAVLAGGDVGGVADVDLAKFSGRDAFQYVFQPPPGMVLNDATLRTDVVQAYGNDRFAIVALRCILSSPRVFGIAHPLIVLRRAEDGRWKVLQVSPSLAPLLQFHTVDLLRPYTTAVKPEAMVEVGGITQAAPVDGDNRTLFPELWWDNAGGDGLLVVEWQRHNPRGGWDPSHMDPIPDDDHRLKIRVPATFASEVAGYRWRVWSLGLGGVTKISAWRTLNIIA